MVFFSQIRTDLNKVSSVLLLEQQSNFLQSPNELEKLQSWLQLKS